MTSRSRSCATTSVRVARPILAQARYDRSTPTGQGFAPAGGTTTLRFRGRKWVSVEPSLGGTIYNCAGGATPWGTWLTCEETVIDLTPKGGRQHGYVFEVRADPAATTGKPIVDMGRMLHEAVAVDPKTKMAYLTEDNPRHSGFYRFTAEGRRAARPGVTRTAGDCRRRASSGSRTRTCARQRSATRITSTGSTSRNPRPSRVRRPMSATPAAASGPFLQAWAQAALWLSRAEGICHHDGKFYFVDTEAGVDAEGRPGYGDGAVWEYDPVANTLRALFVAGSQQVGDNIDNITVSPRGGILLCEDGDPVTDSYGPGTRLIGITREGDSFPFAKNNIELEPEDIAGAGKHILPNDYRGEEWAGACFDAKGEVLFANIQIPGITFAIWGPWERGNL